MDKLPNIKRFFENPNVKNGWFRYGRYMRVYVRRTIRGHPTIEGKWYTAFDIGSVEVSPRQRGKGLFRIFLREFEIAALKEGRPIVYVESILNKGLGLYLKRQGYVNVRNNRQGFRSVNKVKLL